MFKVPTLKVGVGMFHAPLDLNAAPGSLMQAVHLARTGQNAETHQSRNIKGYDS